MKTVIPILILAVSFPMLQAADDWEILFDGKSLDQWTTLKGEPVTKGWEVKDGAIHRYEPGGAINTKNQYENFELEFEWKISEGGNSGVKYRFNNGLGLEYQVLDDAKHKDSQKANHRTASLYDLLAAPDDKPVKPVGEWNKGKIVAKGTKLEHWLNGVKVMEIDQSTEDWKTRFEKSKYKKNKDFGKGAGHIHLQDHGDEVWFRNIRVRKLK